MATKNQTNNESANVQNAQVNNNIMKQFKELKKKHPDAILLFRCGDFYECYGEDSKAVAEVCGLQLTTSGETTMAGFPHHALDTNLPKLIRAGKRVAICDQLEKPKPKPTTDAITTAIKDMQAESEPKAEEPKAEEPKAEKPKKERKPKTEKPKKAESSLTYETYTNKKGKTCARIKGFAEDDARYQVGPELHGSKTWERDKKGGKTYMLVFGPVYAEAAKQLCEAWNSGDADTIRKAVEGVNGTLDAHRKEREAQRSEYKAKAEERKAKKTEKPKTYTEQEVIDLMRRVAAGDKEAMELVNSMAAKAA